MGNLTTTPVAVATGAISIPVLKAQVQHLGQVLDGIKTSEGCLTCQADRDMLEGMVTPFKTIATEKQINGRITRLLINPAYKRAAISEAEMNLVIADWCVALEGFPYWAIELACRWWISADNPRCSYYPTAGEIGRRARVEMANVERAGIAILKFDYKKECEARHQARRQANIEDDERIVAAGNDGSIDYKLACIRLHREPAPDPAPKSPRNRGKSAPVSPSDDDLGERCPPPADANTKPSQRGHVGKSARKFVKQVTEARNKAG